MRLVRLPPYSPELNPVEHLWEEIREKWFPNLAFRELDYVEDVLENALHTLEQDPARVASLAGFDWLVSIRPCQRTPKLAWGMNGTRLEQGFLGDGESPNHRSPLHRGGRRLPQKPPSL